MHSGKLFQVQALGHDLPAELPTDVEGIRKLFYEITGRDDIQILDTEWVSEWRCVTLRVVSSQHAAHSDFQGKHQDVPEVWRQEDISRRR